MALIRQPEDLDGIISEVNRLRKELHDAYIADGAANGSTKPPPSTEPHRSVDNPTLTLLKSPNYPFLLCEEAPPSYVPPPVPYDVEGEVDRLKVRVLNVQDDVLAHQNELGVTTALSPEQILDFFSDNANFAELAWEVSSLQWFYRWVLSHSISHLWNAKEVLEFVLTENNQSVPADPAEMDAALEQFPFMDAVSILENDRQSLIAQERRRIRSVSRTYRDRLPASAVTVATSSYLSAEEKYMYQEFFNQSEHILLLLNHSVMVEKAAGGAGSRSGSGRPWRRSGAGAEGDAADLPAEETAMIVPPSMEELPDVPTLTEDAGNALEAEKEVIQTLMDTIRERKENGVRFEVTDDEYQRSRTAQIAVYGCLVSDMNLMGQQMEVSIEFLSKYEEWLRFFGFEGHDDLMRQLAARAGGTRWPVLPNYGGAGHDHDHVTPANYNNAKAFVPPTEQMRRSTGSQPPAQPQRQQSQQASHQPLAAAPATRDVADPQARSKKDTAADRSRAVPLVESEPRPSSQTPPVSKSSTSRSPLARPEDVFYTLLQQVEQQQPRRSTTAVSRRSSSVAPSPSRAVPLPLDRVWQAVCLYYTACQVSRGTWTLDGLAQNLDRTEEALLRQVQRTHPDLARSASGLLAVLAELVVLVQAAGSESAQYAAVDVPVHIHDDAVVKSGGPAQPTPDSLRGVVLYALTPVEKDRWGCVLDALWTQADPTGAANGKLLNSRESQHRIGFLELAGITLSQGYLNLHYRQILGSNGAPALSLVATTRKAEKSKNSGALRFRAMRRALVALAEVEARGFLASYACRPEEVPCVALGEVLYLTAERSERDVRVSLLPAPAVQLQRLSIHLAEASAAPGTAAVLNVPFDVYTHAQNFSTIPLELAAAMGTVAAQQPVLSDLYLTAETLKEQAQWEIRNRSVNKCFKNASMHPVAVACDQGAPRAISIQRESALMEASASSRVKEMNRNTSSAFRLIPPLLTELEEQLSAYLEANPPSSSARPSVTSSRKHADEL